MLLQIALDLLDLEEAVRLAALLEASCDRIEVGTPLLLRHGVRAISAIRTAAPTALLVADCKTMDCGAVIAKLAFTHGADGLIVQGAAPLATIQATFGVASELGGFVMVDDLGVGDLEQLGLRLDGLPVSHLIIHVGKDEQANRVTPAGRLRRAAETPGLPALAVAGGIHCENLRDIIDGVAPDVVVVGEAIYGSSDPLRVATELKRSLAEDYRDRLESRDVHQV